MYDSIWTEDEIAAQARLFYTNSLRIALEAQSIATKCAHAVVIDNGLNAQRVH